MPSQHSLLKLFSVSNLVDHLMGPPALLLLARHWELVFSMKTWLFKAPKAILRPLVHPLDSGCFSSSMKPTLRQSGSPETWQNACCGTASANRLKFHADFRAPHATISAQAAHLGFAHWKRCTTFRRNPLTTLAILEAVATAAALFVSKVVACIMFIHWIRKHATRFFLSQTSCRQWKHEEKQNALKFHVFALLLVCLC
jgi:hypothetical protein